MPNVIGTLKELNVKPGDVVECTHSDFSWWTVGKEYTVLDCGTPADDNGDTYGFSTDPQPAITFRIVSRASETGTQPKLWKDMTSEEKGALLLAHHEGKEIQVWVVDHGWSGWVSYQGSLRKHNTYRVKPEPVVKTQTITSWGTLNQWLRDGDVSRVHESHCKYKITFSLIDGEPDCNSVKMGEI